jgi:hypothetical protein
MHAQASMSGGSWQHGRRRCPRYPRLAERDDRVTLAVVLDVGDPDPLRVPGADRIHLVNLSVGLHHALQAQPAGSRSPY